MSIAIMLLRGYAYRDIYLEPDMHICIYISFYFMRKRAHLQTRTRKGKGCELRPVALA